MERPLLLPILKKAQKKEGYISEETIKNISRQTKIPVSKIYGVATFYSMLYTKKVGKNVILICVSPSCIVNGSLDLVKFLEEELGIKEGETTKNNKFSLFKTSCIGCCDKAPAMLLNGEPYTSLTKEKLKEIIAKCKS